MRRSLLTAAAAVLIAVSAAACGGAGTQSGGRLDVVASTSFLADIAQNVAGDRFEVRPLVPLGADPHSFEPAPSDIGVVATADLLIVNGGGLEGPLLDTIRSAGGEATIVTASAGLRSRTPKAAEPPLDEGDADPHFWLDPVLVKSYVRTIRDAFVKADPAGEAEYSANAAAYDKKLDRLSTWIGDQIATVPAADRKLVTDHASYGYYADRYGLEIVGTVVPSVGTDDTPTARQLADLVAAIRANGVKAVFVDAGENPDLARQVAAETGVTVVDDLLDHSLTGAGGVAPTYLDMMRFDTRRIVEALR